MFGCKTFCHRHVQYVVGVYSSTYVSRSGYVVVYMLNGKYIFSLSVVV